MAVEPPKFYPINLGPLPNGKVSDALGLPMAEGIVHYSATAQYHSYERHADTFHLCEPYLAITVANPTYIGQAPRYKHDGFEHIYRVPGDQVNVLMAITLRPSNDGSYRVNSVYRIDFNTIMRRLRKGFLTEM